MSSRYGRSYSLKWRTANISMHSCTGFDGTAPSGTRQLNDSKAAFSNCFRFPAAARTIRRLPHPEHDPEPSRNRLSHRKIGGEGSVLRIPPRRRAPARSRRRWSLRPRGGWPRGFHDIAHISMVLAAFRQLHSTTRARQSTNVVSRLNRTSIFLACTGSHSVDRPSFGGLARCEVHRGSDRDPAGLCQL